MRIGGVNNMKKYKIAVAGTGYVGLSIATLLSQHHHETAVDIIPEKVEMINNRKSPIQDDYIEKYLAEKELNLTVIKHEDIVVRNPFSTRPYQHVLEPLYAYLMIAAMQYQDIKYAGYYNVGPDDVDCFQTGALVDLFVSKWGDGMKWVNRYDGGPHEANFLKLDCSKLKTTFGWKPHWNLDTAIEMVVEWSKCWGEGGDIRACMDNEIKLFMES